jgi:hypothetical protein
MRAVPRLCEFCPGICLTTEEKARKNLSQVKKILSQVNKKPQSDLSTEKFMAKQLVIDKLRDSS